MQAYTRATDSHGLRAALALIDDDAVYFFSNKTVHLDKKAIEEMLTYSFGLIQDETYAISDLTWLARSEPVASCVYDFTWSGTVRGQPASGHGGGTTVLKRSANSTWRIIHEHLSGGRFVIE
jgi:ketosteroid isomerase-like protein